MAQSIVSRIQEARSGSSEIAPKTTRALLVCGVVSGPLFTLVAVVQVLTREGFDIRRHAISMLSLGDLGPIQIANFVGTGMLAIACAIGMRRMLSRGRGGTWGPLFVCAYGLGLLTAGIFRTDPALGFPPGAAPAGLGAMSWHGTIHSLAFFVLFLAVIGACFVFARRFTALGQQGWAAFSVAIGLAAPALIVAGMVGPIGAGMPFLFAAVIAFGGVSAIAASLLNELPRTE